MCADAAAAACGLCAAPGDLNGDGVVDPSDLTILLNSWGGPAGVFALPAWETLAETAAPRVIFI
jgi:hypothetical protein